jgi:hypothetical protein
MVEKHFEYLAESKQNRKKTVRFDNNGELGQISLGIKS